MIFTAIRQRPKRICKLSMQGKRHLQFALISSLLEVKLGGAERLKVSLNTALKENKAFLVELLCERKYFCSGGASKTSKY